jgi:hypothetical protein
MTREDFRLVVLAIVTAALFAADFIMLGVPGVWKGY